MTRNLGHIVHLGREGQGEVSIPLDMHVKLTRPTNGSWLLVGHGRKLKGKAPPQG